MIARDLYLRQLIDYMGDGQIKVITGIRRCGKSVLLFHLFYDYLIASGVPADHILQIALDKRKDAKYRNPITLSDQVSVWAREDGEKYYLFIDEIQMAYSVPDPDNPGYEITVYDMLNELKDYPNLDVYVTGSNSKMLSRDIATQFRGRASQESRLVLPCAFSPTMTLLSGENAISCSV